MARIDILKLTPEGHIAIPAKLRKGFKEGQTLLAIRDENRLILEKVSATDERLEEDLEFARRTRNARTRYEKGKFKSLGFDEFIEAMKKW